MEQRSLNRRSTSSALREADEDRGAVPRFYPVVFSDRDPTAAERRRFDVLLDLGRDADVLVVNRDNPVCAWPLARPGAGIARGTITRWSQVAALPAGQPGAIDRHVRGENGYAQPRFGIGLRPHHAVIEPDGGCQPPDRDPAAAALFRQAGVLLTADGPPAATPPYQKSSRPAAGL